MTSAPRDPSGTAGDVELFRERMLPGPFVFLVLALFGTTVGIVTVPLSGKLALTVGAIGVIAMIVIGAVTSPVLSVTRQEVRFGRARIAPHLLGETQVLRGSDWHEVMSTGFRPLEYHCTRGWIHAGVRIPVLDEQDPTPAWVATSRRPEDLALAVTTAQRGRATDRS